jgi:hypothetical protein
MLYMIMRSRAAGVVSRFRLFAFYSEQVTGEPREASDGHSVD